MKNLLPGAAGIVALSASAIAYATAAGAQDTAVGIAPVVDFVLPILLTIVTTMIGVFLPIVLTKLAAKYNLQIEQQKRDALQVTFTNAAAGLIQKLGDEAKTLKMNIQNPDVRVAVNRALQGAPDALRWAGLNEQEIARRILEKIPQVQPAPAPTPIATPSEG